MAPVTEEQLNAVRLMAVLDPDTVPAGAQKTLYYIYTPAGGFYKVKATDPATHFQTLIDEGRLPSAFEFLQYHEELA